MTKKQKKARAQARSQALHEGRIGATQPLIDGIKAIEWQIAAYQRLSILFRKEVEKFIEREGGKHPVPPTYRGEEVYKTYLEGGFILTIEATRPSCYEELDKREWYRYYFANLYTPLMERVAVRAFAWFGEGHIMNGEPYRFLDYDVIEGGVHAYSGVRGIPNPEQTYSYGCVPASLFREKERLEKELAKEVKEQNSKFIKLPCYH